MDVAEHDSAARFRDLGVDVFFCDGRFTAADVVEVEGSRLRFARAVIATGATPWVPRIPGLAEAGFRTTETLFDLTELPPRLAVVGGGPLGCELAQAFARFGSRVQLIELADRLIGEEDADAGEAVRAALAKDGVDLALETRLMAVASAPAGSQLVGQP